MKKAVPPPHRLHLHGYLHKSHGLCLFQKTTNISHLRENIKAVNITWTKKEMEEINKRLSKIKLYGERYQPESDAAKSVYNLI